MSFWPDLFLHHPVYNSRRCDLFAQQKQQVPLNVPDAIIKCFRQSASSAMPQN